MTTERHSKSSPLYSQLKYWLTQDIKQGKYRAGDYLPPENELCLVYSVSRITVRRAVADLCDEGVLKKVRGKGTVVNSRQFTEALVSLSGFTETMEKQGHPSRYRIISVLETVHHARIAQKLSEEENAPLTEIQRLLLVEGAPLTLEILYFNGQKYAEVITPVSESHSFYQSLHTFYGIIPAHSERIINVDFPTANECELLKCNLSDPIYRIEKLLLNKEKQPVSFSQLITPADRVSYTLTL